MEPLFPVVPADLSTLSVEEMTQLRDELKSLAAAVLAASKPGGDITVFGGRDATKVVEEYAAAVVEIKRVDEALAAHAAGQEAFATALADEAAKVGISAEGDDATDDDDGDGSDDDGDAAVVDAAEAIVEEAAVVEEADAVVAAAEATPTFRLPAPSSLHQAVPAGDESGRAMVAAGGLDGVRPGQILNPRELALAIKRSRETQMHTPEGFEQKAVVASISYELPEERQLTNDYSSDWAKIQAVRGPEAVGINPETGEKALVASGGLCAPVNNYYELQMLSTAERPVRAALTQFAATRGGIKAAAPPTLAAVTTGVGYKTVAQDGGGGTLANKTCQQVACPSFSEVDVQMVYHCLKFGNLQSRTFPEQVEQFTALTLAAHARLAEGLLLDAISAGSTAVTTAADGGAVNSLLNGILELAAGMRSRHRMTPGARIRVLLPEWVKDELVLDLIKGQFDRFERNQSGVEALLRMFNVEPGWYLDSATGAGQVFGAQTAGAALTFPATAVYYMYPEGSWLFLDNGQLDLGIVRDSTLNTTNDYSVFGETFENAALVGIESLKVTATFKPCGAVAAPADVSC